MAVWYLTWGVLAYVMTLGKSSQQARDWVFTGQIVMLAAELAIVTTPGSDGVLPSWLFPRMAEYEVTNVMRRGGWALRLPSVTWHALRTRPILVGLKIVPVVLLAT